jgi:hypothetical protein
MSNVTTVAPVATCTKDKVLWSGVCVSAIDLVAGGWVKQEAVSHFMLVSSCLLFVAYLNRSSYYVLMWKILPRAPNPIKDLRFISCVASLFAFICAFLSRIRPWLYLGYWQYVFYTVMLALSQGIFLCSTVGIIIHVFNYYGAKFHDIRLTLTYTNSAKIAVAFAVFFAMFQVIWNAVINAKFRGTKDNLAAAGRHILALNYVLIAIVSLSLVGVIKNLNDKQNTTTDKDVKADAKRLAKISLIWMLATIYICGHATYAIYFFHYKKAKIPPVDLKTQYLMAGQAELMKWQEIQEKLSYLNIAQQFLNLIYLIWDTIDILPFQSVYWLISGSQVPATIHSDITRKKTTRSHDRTESVSLNKMSVDDLPAEDA